MMNDELGVSRLVFRGNKVLYFNRLITKVLWADCFLCTVLYMGI